MSLFWARHPVVPVILHGWSATIGQFEQPRVNLPLVGVHRAVPVPLAWYNVYGQTSFLGPAHDGGGIAIKVFRNRLPGIEPVVDLLSHLAPPS
jgi:hypothetical protein